MTPTATATKPTITPADPTEAYRQMVIDAAQTDESPEPNKAILDAADRLPSDFRIDVALFRKRLDARHALDVEVPELEKQAAEIRNEIAAAKRGDEPIGKMTVAELAQALASFYSATNPSVITDAQLRLRHVEVNIGELRSESQRTLSTTADPGIDREIVELQKRIGHFQNKMRDRAPLLNLESRIGQLERDIEALADGHRPSHFAGSTLPTKELWKQAKQKRADLIAQRPAVEIARADQVSDEREIGKLQKRIAELHRSKLVPKNLAWV